MHSLKTKIALITTAMIVTVMIVAAVLGVVAIRNMGNENAEQTLLLLCEAGEKNLDTYFLSVEQSVEMVAVYVEEDLDGIDDVRLQAHLDRVSNMFQSLTFKTNGILTYYYRIDPAVSKNVDGFWYVNERGNGFREHAVTDINLYDVNDTTKLVWFTVPRATGKPVWLRPYITESLNVRVLSYNVPVYFKEQFIGVIGIEIDDKVMAEQVNNITLYKNGYAFITEPDSSIVYHPRIDVARMLEPPKAPSELQNSNTIVHYTYDGVEKMAVGLPLVNGMQLHVTVPVEEINASWKNWVKSLLTVFAALLAVFILIVLLYAERITKPLRELAEAAKQVDKGNYDYKMQYHGKDEVADLTSSFTALTDHLRVRISSLNNLANVDALTSLRNKRSFDTFLNDMEVELNSGGKKMEFALCIFDCNYLKNINDTYGHDKGDLYLQKTASVICDVFKHSPVFRIGGDEFAAILTGIDYKNRDHLTELFQKTCESIRKTNTERWEQVDVAWGLAVYDPKEDNSVNDVFRRADRLMYQNKWSGRDLTSPGKNR